MLNGAVRMPPDGNGDVQQQLKEIRDYLKAYNRVYVTEDNVTEIVLRNALDAMQSDSPDAIATGAIQRAGAIRDLIIKTAKEIESHSETIKIDLSSDYLAKSDFGTYFENARVQIGLDSVGITQLYNYVSGIRSDFGDFNVDAQYYIKTGLLYYDGINPIYGVSVGNIRKKIDEGGHTILDLSNLVSTLTEDEIAFWRNGEKMMWMNTTDGLHVPAAAIDGKVTANQINTNGLIVGYSNLPDDVASTGDIPTDAQITTIIGDTITTGYIAGKQIKVTDANIQGTITAGKLDVSGIITVGNLSTKNSTVASVSVLYALSTSSTTAPTTGWSKTAPAWQDGKYMWQKTVWTYADGNTSESTPTNITGAKGDAGTSVRILGSYNTYAELIAAHPTGNIGDAYLVSGYLYVWSGSAWQNVGQIKGDQGETGKGISSITEEYYLSTSNVTPAGGSWSTTCPVWTPTKYIWVRSHIVWSDSTEGYTTPTIANAINGANEAAQSAAVAVRDIEGNIYVAGTTTIDGGKIHTGSVTALQINATNLHIAAGNVDGTLTIGQLPNTVAQKSEIPTKVSDLTNDSGFQNATGVTSIVGGIVTTDFVDALGIHAQAANISGKITASQINTSGLVVGFDNLPSNVAKTGDIPTTSEITTIIGNTVTTGYIEGKNISVGAGQITGTLTIGQLPNTLALKTEIPTNNNQLTNGMGYQNATGVTSIVNGTVTTDFVEALGIHVSAANVDGRLTIGQLPTTVAQTSDIPTDAEITTIIGNTITTGYIAGKQIKVTDANISGKLTASVIDATNLVADGISANNATVSGDITATSGNIGGFRIVGQSGLHYIARTPTGLSGGLPFYICGDNDWSASYSSPIGSLVGGVNGLALRIGEASNATFGIGYDGQMLCNAGRMRSLWIIGDEITEEGGTADAYIVTEYLNPGFYLNPCWRMRDGERHTIRYKANGIYGVDSLNNETRGLEWTGASNGSKFILDANHTYLSDDPYTLLKNRLGGTCLIEGTKILMADGTEKNIEDVETGELIMSYDPGTGENCEAMCLLVERTGVSSEYTAFVYEDGSNAQFFGKHSVWEERTECIKGVDKWKVGDGARMSDGNINKLISIDPVEHGIEKGHYVLISSNNLYYANNILMGHGTTTKYKFLRSNTPKEFPEEILSHYKDRIEANNTRREYHVTPEFLTRGAGILKRMRFAQKQIDDDEKSLADSDYRTTHRVESFFVGLKRMRIFTLTGIKSILDGLDDIDDSARNTWRDRINAKRAELATAQDEYNALKRSIIPTQTKFKDSVTDGNSQLPALKEWAERTLK